MNITEMMMNKRIIVFIVLPRLRSFFKIVKNILFSLASFILFCLSYFFLSLKTIMPATITTAVPAIHFTVWLFISLQTICEACAK